MTKNWSYLVFPLIESFDSFWSSSKYKYDENNFEYFS